MEIVLLNYGRPKGGGRLFELCFFCFFLPRLDFRSKKRFTRITKRIGGTIWLLLFESVDFMSELQKVSFL